MRKRRERNISSAEKSELYVQLMERQKARTHSNLRIYKRLAHVKKPTSHGQALHIWKNKMAALWTRQMDHCYLDWASPERDGLTCFYQGKLNYVKTVKVTQSICPWKRLILEVFIEGRLDRRGAPRWRLENVCVYTERATHHPNNESIQMCYSGLHALKTNKAQGGLG